MSKCPSCGSINQKPKRTWKYGNFTVQSYIYGNRNTQYRDYYDKSGKYRFTLKLKGGKGYVKV